MRRLPAHTTVRHSLCVPQRHRDQGRSFRQFRGRGRAKRWRGWSRIATVCDFPACQRRPRQCIQAPWLTTSSSTGASISRPAQVDEIMPGVRRILCNNPSPFTFKGTVSYIIGRGKVAIVDPGPDDAAHIAALLDAVRGETVTHIFVTHTHRDHSPAVARIKAATGATVYAEGPHRPSRPRASRRGAAARCQRRFRFPPRRAHCLMARWSPATAGTVEAVTTPGHTANHMALPCAAPTRMFIGDHVMAWSTTVVAPPDGAMDDYMASLAKLTQRERDDLFPRPRRAGARRASFVAQLIASPQRPRGVDPASAGERAGRHSDPGARDLYRHRSAAGRRGGTVGVCASGGLAPARPGRLRGRAVARRDLSSFRRALARLRRRLGRRLSRLRQGASAASSRSSISAVTRAALVPKSCMP